MRIAVLQMKSLEDFHENLKVVRSFAEKAANEKAKILFLPECFYSMSDGLKPTPFLVEDHNEHYQNISKIAKDYGLSLVGGSAATKLNGNVVNRAYNFDSQGQSLGHYDKINLFSCDIQKEGQRKSIDEADIYTPGNTPQLINVEGIKIGLGICFDLRYPEMARQYVREGAQLLTFASAFTVPTGKAHWHTLVRARAIENQCFVVAAAQWGRHNERIQTYGHSLVVDPWGDVLLDAEEGEGQYIIDLDMERIETVRKSVKVFK